MPSKWFIGKVIYLSYIDEKPTGHIGFIAAHLDEETGFPQKGCHIFQKLDDLIQQFQILNKTGLDLELEAPEGIDKSPRDDNERYRRYETLSYADCTKVSIALGNG